MSARLMTVGESIQFFSRIPHQELLLIHGQHQMTVQMLFKNKPSALANAKKKHKRKN